MSNEAQSNNESNNARSKPANEAGANKLPNKLPNKAGANSVPNRAGANKLPNSVPNKIPSRVGFGLIVRTVIFLYIAWVGVVISDLVSCRLANKSCDAQVGEVKGVFTTVTVGLMGWVSDGPTGL